MKNLPPTIYPKTGEPVPHTAENWRVGKIVFDLSHDADLAAKGDEAAQARLETARLLELKRRVREE